VPGEARRPRRQSRADVASAGSPSDLQEQALSALLDEVLRGDKEKSEMELVEGFLQGVQSRTGGTPLDENFVKGVAEQVFGGKSDASVDEKFFPDEAQEKVSRSGSKTIRSVAEQALGEDDASADERNLPCAMQKKVASRSNSKTHQAERVLREEDALADDEKPAKSAARKKQTAASKARMLRALEEASQQLGLGFSEVAGQILWRNRQSKSLQEARFQRIARDISWMGGPLTDQGLAPDFVNGVEQLFQVWTAKQEGVTFRWVRKAIELIEKNPILRSRVRRTDVDRLFYSLSQESRSKRTLSLSGFKEFLMQLAEVMEVHPLWVFMAVGCHAEEEALRASF